MSRSAKRRAPKHGVGEPDGVFALGGIRNLAREHRRVRIEAIEAIVAIARQSSESSSAAMP